MAGTVGRALTGDTLPPERRAARRRFRDPGSGELLDEGLLLWFPGPRSFTGEDLVEIHHHGSRAVVQGLATALVSLPGVRPAEPGEFTKRAFLNGKLDLTEVEGLADLIEATTRAQARQALRQMAGELGTKCAAWRETIIRALASVEAEIDFAADEGDVAQGLSDREAVKLAAVRDEIADVLQRARQGERLREGLTVAITGAPNVGKSSIINILSRRDVAIVTPVPGTTRDVLEVALELRGLPVVLLDTAGLRETDDPIEKEGVERGMRRAAQADLRLLVLDATAPEDAASCTSETLVVVNKVDLVADRDFVPSSDAVAVSCRTGAGIDRLVEAIAERAETMLGTGETSLLTRERHRVALWETHAALARFLASAGSLDLGLRAEELRLAMDGLGKITGRVRVEELLDRIFAEFCIGK